MAPRASTLVGCRWLARNAHFNPAAVPQAIGALGDDRFSAVQPLVDGRRLTVHEPRYDRPSDCLAIRHDVDERTLWTVLDRDVRDDDLIGLRVGEQLHVDELQRKQRGET